MKGLADEKGNRLERGVFEQWRPIWIRNQFLPTSLTFFSADTTQETAEKKDFNSGSFHRSLYEIKSRRFPS